MMKYSHPEAIFIQLHTFCNSECINCPFEFTYNSIHQKGRMSDSTWNKILSDIIDMEFTGQVGFYLHHEPLIDKTLFDKIKDVNEKTKAYVVLSTNAQLLNDENTKKLIEAKPRKVHLNINSGNKAEYETSMKGLSLEVTINNCRYFINQAKGIIDIEINCPVIEGFDVNSLNQFFHDVKVNLDYWANSRGGLLPEFFNENKGSRFKTDNFCNQPSQNFNILFDGSTIACCMDWMHESKKDFYNINNSSILEVYNEIKKLEKSFKDGDYSKYKMCKACSREMGFYRKEKNLKILITNHHLLDFTGSEIYTFTLAENLRQKGHDVTIYTKYTDKIIYLFEAINVKVVTNIDEIKNEQFDIAHIHHNIMAIEIRYHFPKLPMIFLSHGIIPFLEQPPEIDLNISIFLAVSEEVKNNLINKNVDENIITIYRNVVDTNKFKPEFPINTIPQTALILSNKIDSKTEEIILEACERLKINVLKNGMKSEEISQEKLPQKINKADIVFSLGRGIIETMMCERIPIVLDYNGGDGIVTTENFELLMQKNFSGRTHNINFTVEQLVEEIKKYNSLDAKKLKQIALRYFNAEEKIYELIDIYKNVIKNFKEREINSGNKQIINSIIKTAEVTNYFTQIKTIREKKIYQNIDKEDIQTKIKKRIRSKLRSIEFKLGRKRNHRNYNIKCEVNYDIVIPIYNAYEHLSTCINSVIKHTDKNHSIYLLDDASPDKRVSPLLKTFAEKNLNVHLITNETNIGFIQNVNKGFVQSKNNVIILNSDTEVTQNWIEKLHSCLLSSDRIGIVSPLSNNATILSVPNMNQQNKLPEGMNVEQFAKLVEENSLRIYPRIPTAVGFCMLITRKVLEKVGSFDTIFGLGYGEENDLCLRARNSGFEIACADDTYIHHYGSASFIDVEEIDSKRIHNKKILLNRYPNYEKEILEYCRLNPLRETQERISTAIQKTKNNNSNILHVIHYFNAAGGTELHTKNMIEALSKNYNSSIFYPTSLANKWMDMEIEQVTKQIRIIKLASENIKANDYFIGFAGDLENELVETNFAYLLSGSNFEIVHFQHLAGFGSLYLPFIAKLLGKKVIISLHDYYLLCPEYNLVLPDVKKKCGKNRVDENDPQCQYCLASKRVNKSDRDPILLTDYIKNRNEIIKQIIEIADAVIAPSNFVKDLFIRNFDKIISKKLFVISHGVRNFNQKIIKKKSNNLNVAFLGNATDRKGVVYLLEAAYVLKNESINFVIHGNIPAFINKTAKDIGIKLKGNYKVENLPNLLSNIDVVIIPSICDETFALTLSEVQSLGIPVVASKVGGITERIIDNETGFLIPPSDSLAIAQKLMELYKNPNLLIKVEENLKRLKIKTLEENFSEYETLYKTLLVNKTPKQFQFSSLTNRYQNIVTKVSIIILTYNQQKYTKECIESIYKNTSEIFELIIVDNNSTDGTKEYLTKLKKQHQNVSVIFKEENLGFPKAINQGILKAKGDYILIANNDIVVTKNWLERMIEITESDSKIGIVGPISNFVSGVQIDKNAKYNSINEMHKYANRISIENKNQIQEFPRIAFLCTLIKKEVIEKIGGLDERFSPGNFEDDDFCLRAQLAGYKTVISKDVFIHHYGSVSFKANGENNYSERLKINKQKFIDKWGADPEEIWLKGKLCKNRNIKFSIHHDLFKQSIERAFQNIDENEIDFALENIKLSIKYFDQSDRIGYENISKEELINIAGNLALSNNELEEAKNWFEKELEINPNSSSACFGLGEIYNKAEMFEESKTMLEWAVVNDIKNQNAKIKLEEVNQKLNLSVDHNSLLGQKIYAEES